MAGYRNATYTIGTDGRLIWHKVKDKKTKKPSCNGHIDVSDIRAAIFNRDNNKCVYCGSNQELHLDHVMPKSIFPWHDIYNLVTACKKCNYEKGRRILMEPCLSAIMLYLKTANRIFSKDIANEYRNRLTEYYTVD
jgi:hypothetical protein